MTQEQAKVNLGYVKQVFKEAKQRDLPPEAWDQIEQACLMVCMNAEQPYSSYNTFCMALEGALITGRLHRPRGR